MSRRPDDLAALKDALADNAESLLVELYGQPKTKRAREWRFGRNGGVSYQPIKRRFSDFSEGIEGGSLLDAILSRQGLSFPAAIEWARAWLGEDPAQRPTPRPRPVRDDTDDRQIDLNEARELWRAGRSIHGTAAARYLQGRAITGWPAECVRFIGAGDVARISSSPDPNGEGRKPWSWWRHPAIMFPLVNAAGDVGAVQLIALTDQGAAITDDDGKKLKRTRGVKAGCAVRFPGDAAGPLLLAEGAETALSVWLATGHETWAILGSWRQAPLDGVAIDRGIVVCRDDDPRTPKTFHTRRRQRETIAEWRAAGRHVVEAQPWPLSRGDKSDFNDALQADGPDAVRERIDAALRPQENTQGKPRVDAMLQLSTTIGRVVGELVAWEGEAPSPFKVVRATLGLGKSHAALEAVIDAVGRQHRVIYSAPTHSLLAELADRARALAAKRGKTITVRVYHGRDRDDPDAPGQKMCRDLEAAELAQQAGLDVKKTVCDAPCPHSSTCPYLAQRETQADLWIVPHALLSVGMPPAMKGASLLIIDEGFAVEGFIGLDGQPRLVPLSVLADHVTHGNGSAEASADLDATLRPLRCQLLDAVADHPAEKAGEPLQRAALVAAGLTADQAAAARNAEGKRERRVDAIAAATRADLLRELRLIRETNVNARRATRLWRNVEDLLADDGPDLSGRVELVTIDGNGKLSDEGSARAFRLFGVEKLGKAWRELPALHLDATADMALIKLRVPHAELVAKVEASEPHVTVHQVVGRTFGKVALEHGRAADDARRFALARAAEHGGRWLIVASKVAADEWRDILPSNVTVAHWGAVRGLDSFKDVRGIVCVGRWGITPDAVGRMAGVITGRAVPRLDGGFPIEAVTLTAADGSSRTIDADRHPDATAEAVRRSLVNAELVQAIGRGRGVQRGPDSPLVVYVLGNTPLPVPLASLSDWQPIDCHTAMLADTGAWLESPTDAAAVTGQTPRAVQLQRQRSRLCSSSIRYSLIENEHHLPDGLAAGTYQRKGAGRAETRIVYDRARIPDPQAWLEAQLGPLVFFEADQAIDNSHRETVEAPAIVVPDLPAITTTVSHAQLDQLRAQDSPAIDLAPPSNPLPPGYEPVPIETPAPAAATSLAGWLIEPAPNPMADYAGGLMSEPLAAFVRTVQRSGQLTQQQLADLARISRPQLANALQGRFGLSPEAAARLRSALATVPTAQPSLL
jgi:putative DNA primase/helicase